MSTVINTNIAAVRTHNVYNRNNDYMNQALTRVATGQKINSAKDGASTWAISEKMRERIRANDQANQNVQNDTALLKTAEGGISNTIDILKTLKERAINAANDTNMNTDRSVIAEEVRQLVKQINDNADQVKFNGRTLLKGDAASDTAATLSSDPDVAAASGASGASATAADPTDATNSVYTLGKSISDFLYYDSGNSNTATANDNITLANLVKTGALSASDTIFAADDKIQITWKDSNGDTQTSEFTIDSSALSTKLSELSLTSTDGLKLAYQKTANDPITDKAGNDVKAALTQSQIDSGTTTAGDAQVGVGLYLVGKADTYMDISAATIKVVDSSGADKSDAMAMLGSSLTAAQEVPAPDSSSSSDSQLTFHIGGEKAFSIQMTLNNMQSNGSVLNLGTADAFAKKFLDAGDAKDAIDTIDKALSAALKEQTRIGAYETRLGYASDNLTTMNENLEAADSVMRDSDIAKEMTNYMKYSVLAQASQYMLAQAGQNAFSVLNLLQA